MTPGHDRVPADDPPGGDRRAQKPVRPVGLGDHQKARSLLVEPVDHPCPLRLALARETAPTPQQGVHERAGPVPGCRVHDHPGGLVHHQKRVIFVDNAHRDVFA